MSSSGTHDRQAPSRARQTNDRIDEAVRGVLLRAGANRGVGRMLLALAVAFTVFAVLNPRVFLNPVNIQNIGVAAPEVGVLAIAITLAMLTGGIDLSLVSIANLSAISMVTLYTALAGPEGQGAPALTVPVVLLGLAVGVACGALNGVLVGVVGITPILATLGTMQLLNGLAVVWTGGSTLYGAPPLLPVIGRTAVGPVPVLLLVLLAIAVLVALVINKTALGRRIQLEGANPVAARFSGISTRRVLLSTYTLSGALAGVAGVLFITRNPTASADYGASYVLLIIVIAVLGGTRPDGGFASVAGVVLATLTLQVVASGFTALRMSSYEYAIAQGVILLAIMILDAVSVRRPRSLRGRAERTPAPRAPDPAGPPDAPGRPDPEPVPVAHEGRRDDTATGGTA